MATPTPLTKRLGRKIRHARKEKELTQLDLAHKIGMKGGDAGAYISRVEQGRTQPRLTGLQKLAKVLGVPMESLLGKA